jgi:hypothetical protein
MHLRGQHSEILQFCTNIRTGLLRGIGLERINRYSEWYWNNHLQPHFADEESAVFPILGKTNTIVKKAMAAHNRIRRLFRSESEELKVISRIEEELMALVRFEERVLYKEIENQLGVGNADVGDWRGAVDINRLQWPDEFWK